MSMDAERKRELLAIIKEMTDPMFSLGQRVWVLARFGDCHKISTIQSMFWIANLGSGCWVYNVLGEKSLFKGEYLFRSKKELIDFLSNE